MRPVREPLAAADEANLILDRDGQVNVFLAAGLLAPGGFVGADGAPDMAELRASLRHRVSAAPELCRSLSSRGRRHHWLATTPDLEQHVRLVERIDGLPGLERMCAALMNEPLSRERPLWELLVVPSAREAEVGIVLRVHHALADGAAAVGIVQRLFEAAEPGPVVAHPVPARSRRGARSMLLGRGAGVHRVRETLRRNDLAPTMLLGDRSPGRGLTFLSADLDGLAGRMRLRGATVNDALLAGVASGLRAALSAAGEPIPDQLPVSVPVALRRRGSAGNQVGVMLVRLPLALADPDERLRLIAARTREDKRSAREQGTLELMRGPIGARIMDRVARRQRLVAAFVTNVRGPDTTLRLAGAPLVALWPAAVLAGNVRLGVAAVSYGGTMWCCVHFDAAHVPGVAFTGAMNQELVRLGG